MFVVYRKSGINFWPVVTNGKASLSGGNVMRFDGQTDVPHGAANGGLQGAAYQACKLAEEKGCDVQNGEVLLVRNVMETGGIRLIRVSIAPPAVSKWSFEEA